MIPVETFGLHYEGAVAWLVQGRGGANFLGLNQKCPFEGPQFMCNHLILPAAPIPDRINWTQFLAVARDPLVQAMFPLPHPPGLRAYYLDDPGDQLGLPLGCLSRLSSPITPVVRPAWMVKTTKIEKELKRSNIQPLVLTQMDLKCRDLLMMVAQATNYLPRTVIMTGTPDLPMPQGVTRLQTSLTQEHLEDLITMPLETLGATVLKRFSRNEDLLGPIETREERRDRIARERQEQK